MSIYSELKINGLRKEISCLEDGLKNHKERLKDFALRRYYGKVKEQLQEIQMTEAVLPILRQDLERLKKE